MSALERPVRALIFCMEEYTDACCQLASDVIDAVRAKIESGSDEDGSPIGGGNILDVVASLSRAMQFKGVETDMHRRFLILDRYWQKHEVRDIVVTVTLVRDMMRAYADYHEWSGRHIADFATAWTPPEEQIDALDVKKDAVDQSLTVFTNELEAIFNVFHPDQGDS